MTMEETFYELLAANASSVADEVAAEYPGSAATLTLTMAAYAAYGNGVQFGLELAQLYPHVAYALVMCIHKMHEQTDPKAIYEFNQHPNTFVQRLRAHGD